MATSSGGDGRGVALFTRIEPEVHRVEFRLRPVRRQRTLRRTGPQRRRDLQRGRTVRAALLYALGFIVVVLGRPQLFTETTVFPVILVLDRGRGSGQDVQKARQRLEDIDNRARRPADESLF